MASEGTDYIAAFTPFPASFGKEWTIAVVVPVDDFVGAVKEANLNSLFIAAAVLIVGVFVIALFGRWIARPIRALAGEAGKIRDLDLEEDISVRSTVAEVDRKSTRLNSSHTDISRMPSSA